MKRLWKTTAALLMSTAFVASSVACGTDSTSSIDGSSSSSASGASSDLSTGYVSAALDQLFSAKSVKLSISGKSAQSKLEGGESWSYAADVDAEIVLSRTETGMNMMMSSTVTDGDGDESVTKEYLIGDYSYSYDEDIDMYIASPTSFYGDEDSVSGMLEGVLESLSETVLEKMETIDTTDIVKSLASLLDEKGTVSETSASVSLSYDAVSIINLIITQINGIDEETMTLENAINMVLGLVGDDVNVNVLLDAVKPFGTYTLSQATTAIDTILADYDVSLKDIKDVALEAIGDETLEGLVTANVLTEAQLTALKTGTIQEILSAFGLADMTVNQLIGSLIASGNDDGTEAAFSLADFIDNTVKPYLKNTTLASAEIYMPPLDGITVNKAKANADIVLGKESIDKLEFGFEFGMVKNTSDDDGVVSSKNTDVSMKIAVEPSSSPVTVSLPADAKILWSLDNQDLDTICVDGFSAEIDFSPDYSWEAESEKWTASGGGGITVYSEGIEGFSIYYSFSYEPLSVSNMNVINIVVSRAAVRYNGTEQVLSGDKLKEFLGKVNFELRIDGKIDLSAFASVSVGEEENWTKFY